MSYIENSLRVYRVAAIAGKRNLIKKYFLFQIYTFFSYSFFQVKVIDPDCCHVSVRKYTWKLYLSATKGTEIPELANLHSILLAGKSIIQAEYHQETPTYPTLPSTNCSTNCSTKLVLACQENSQVRKYKRLHF